MDGFLQLGQQRLAQIARQLLGAAGQIAHRAGDHAADLLDVPGSLRAGVGQTPDLPCHNSEALPRLSGPRGLYGGVDGDEVCGGGDGEDRLGERANLVHAPALLNGPVEHGHDLLCPGAHLLHLPPGRALHLLRPSPHLGRIGGHGGALLRHTGGLILGAGGAGIDGCGISGNLLQGGGEPLRQAGEGPGAAAGGPGPPPDLTHHAADALGAVLQGAHGVPDGHDDMPPDDPQRRPHQHYAGGQRGGGGDQGDSVHPGQTAPGRLCLGGHGGGQGVQAALGGGASGGHIPVGHGIGLLGLAVGAGGDQIDQGVLESVIVIQQGAVHRLVVRADKSLVVRQLPVQHRLLRLDLLHQLDHGGVICRHDVGQGQAVEVHHGAADLLQLRLADHVLVHNSPGVGVDIVNAEHRQEIGQQRYQSQQDNRQDQALLQC